MEGGQLITSYYESPVGLLEIQSRGESICGLLFKEEKKLPVKVSPLIEKCIQQLEEYFSESRKYFELPLSPEGTVFQKQVWNELLKIPFAKTISYMQLARQLGDEKKIRAAGTANGRNPIAIIIPCHRVIGSNGMLVGYGGGLWRKKWLLELESGNSQSELF